MKISESQLHQIILEEYIKEENLNEADQEEIEKLLRQIQGDKYRSPEERDPARYKTNDGNTAPMDSPMKSEPSDAAAQDMSLQSQISQMVSGMSPDEVAELFQSVFSSLPGVEMQDDEQPPSLYGDPEADGRTPISLGPVREDFDINTLQEMIRKSLRNL
tara:strand:+ start:43 stop:522 length:480 start_codon:yes stop_codon:yes gene_type:complete